MFLSLALKEVQMVKIHSSSSHYPLELTSPRQTPPITDHKIFVRNLYTFYFRQCFTVFFDFCYFSFELLEWTFQVHKNKNSLGFPACIHLHRWRVSQLLKCLKHNAAGKETWIQSWRFLLPKANHLLFTVRISTNHSNTILVHFISWFFHALQTLAPTSGFQIII